MASAAPERSNGPAGCGPDEYRKGTGPNRASGGLFHAAGIFKPHYKYIKRSLRRNGEKMERTLSIIKPDGVRKNIIGDVVGRFEKNGLKVAAMKMVSLSKAEAEGFYAVHRERPFFGSLTDFMSSGPVVLMVLAGENAIQKNRDLMGATDPKKAAPGTIRKDFADSIESNIVHGSDGAETAAFEIGYFFSGLEVLA